MEKRKVSVSKPSSLPIDYTRMVCEVFTAYFGDGLKIYETLRPNSHFSIHGEVCSDEIVIGVSLVSEGLLSATTVYASTDFDPKASAPTTQDLLSVCVDAAASTFDTLLDPNHPEIISQVSEESLAALESVPIDWTRIEINQRPVFVKLDKANLELDSLADEFLKKDPHYQERDAQEQKETEKLFFTGKEQKERSRNGSS